MNILVTGVAGFIGSHLAERFLSNGDHVIGMDNFDSFYPRPIKENNLKSLLKNPNFSFEEGDICDIDFINNLFAKYKIDKVIHLAAKAGVRPSIAHPSAYYSVNVLGTLNILDVMNQYKVKKLIFASSSSVYGNNHKIPFIESDNVDFPISPYAATKKAGELLTHTYHHLYDFQVINLRFFTVYGPRQRPDLAIHKFFKSIYNSKPIDVYGNGSTSRDYTYVDDIVDGIVRSSDYLETNNKIYEIINLGNNSPISLIDLINKIEVITGKQIQKNVQEMQEGDVDRTYADISKAKKLLGYNPHTSMEQGLVNFKLWYEENY